MMRMFWIVVGLGAAFFLYQCAFRSECAEIDRSYRNLTLKSPPGPAYIVVVDKHCRSGYAWVAP